MEWWEKLPRRKFDKKTGEPKRLQTFKSARNKGPCLSAAASAELRKSTFMKVAHILSNAYNLDTLDGFSELAMDFAAVIQELKNKSPKQSPVRQRVRIMAARQHGRTTVKVGIKHTE
jgi:hypothetical protein